MGAVIRRRSASSRTPSPFTRRARVRADRRAIDTLIDGEIAHFRANTTGDPDDVLEALVANDDLTDAEIRDQVVTLIGAGYDTTAASLAWMLWCPALSPDTWLKLRVEADDVFGSPQAGDQEGDHTTTLNALAYANQVMRETLRLHPAGVVSPREAAQDIALGDLEIRKGTLVLWSAYLAGRDAQLWVDPLIFDPDRFTRLDDDQQAVANSGWVPFGGGRRNCIGFALAQMELALIISRLAQRLDIEPTSTTSPSPVGTVVNRPTGGVPMRVHERTG